MAVFAVTWDASAFGRLDAADSSSNWDTEGVQSVGAEPDWYYQGSACMSGLVKTSEVGFYCAPGSTNMSATARVWIAKINQTNKNAIDPAQNGLQVRIGSSTSAYYYYYLFHAATYPIAGGFQIVVIDPNVSQWRTGNSGSPSLSAINYFALRSECNATAKTQNLGMDAIDVMNVGTGLTGIRGDSTDTDGAFADFLAADEGTSSNRWGIVTSRDGVLYVNGVLTIGSSGVATEFTDRNAQLVFPHQRVTTGFCGLDFDIQNSGTVITLDNCVFNGRGDLYSSDDTRPDYTVTGTSGTLDIVGCTFNTFRQINFTNVCSVLSSYFINGLKVVAAGADLSGSTIDGCTGAADTSALSWDVATDPDGYLDNMSFVKGTTATHAVDFGTNSPLTMTLRGCNFSGYNAADSQTDSTFYFSRTSSNVTLNLSGCTGNVKVKTAGCTVDVVVDPVDTTIVVKDIETLQPVENARVLLLASDGTGDFPYQASVTISRSGSTATVSHTAHGMATDDVAYFTGANQEEYNGAFVITKIDADSYSYTVPGTPTTPATGTIKATGGVFNTLTNSSGLVTDNRSWTNEQPFVGRVRKHSSSPYYETSPLSGTIDTEDGYSTTVYLIPDE